MDTIILNADLGEGEPLEKSTALIQHIGAANIACGGHAGNDESMKHCLKTCLEHGTLPGAHPGMSGHFGRGLNLPTTTEFHELLKSQWHSLNNHAENEGISLHHIKLHGTLYLAVEHHIDLADTYLEFLSALPVTPVIFCLAGGIFGQQAKALGFDTWDEIFGDRNYQSDGSLMPRSHPEALIPHPKDIERRIKSWLSNGSIQSQDSVELPIAAKTICLHADTKNALETAKCLQSLLLGLRK